MNNIIARGVRTHNLKNFDCQLPRNKLIVITGLSGSGKSSLAFDTLYAEGQRRYVESLSTYARQFLSVMDKPDVDHIDGLSPAISIEQKSTSHNPRSTVGTITEIYDYLRLLYARVGMPECPVHRLPLSAQTISQMVDTILELPADTKIMLLAPIVQQRKGEHAQQLKTLLSQGFLRVQIDDEIYEITDIPKLNKNKKHTIKVVVDRLKVKKDSQTRIADSLETTLNLAAGLAEVVLLDNDNTLTFSANYACSKCGYSIPELEPRCFSFNSPSGACEACDGLGTKQFMDPDKIIFDAAIDLASGAIRGWDKHNFYFYSMLQSLAKHFDFCLETPYKKLPKKIKNILLHGSDETIKFVYAYDKHRKVTKKHSFEGVLANMERRYRDTESQYVREELAKFLSKQLCPECNGSRLKKMAQHVYISNRPIAEITKLSISQASSFFKNLKLSGWRVKIAKKILKEISARLEFLKNVGLEYLSLDRSADSLSGGEAQRIRLASQIGAGLVGVMYVLDEPSIGLHQRDYARLIKTLSSLLDLGNTVIVVEHDADTIKQADYILDIGPGAGIHGGEIVACGPLPKILQNKRSLTGKYLSGKETIAVPKQRLAYKPGITDELTLTDSCENNLKNLTVQFPIGLLTCVTGVSGSGKSSLINDTLYPVLAQQLNKAQPISIGKYHQITGLEHLDKVVDISQSPIGRTPRSNPATYTGLFNDIRDLFAGVPEARSRGYKPGRFSFNVKGGRCEACKGDGLIKVEMHFLPDAFVPCDVCQGKRYNRETLEIYYKGKNIYEVLAMTVEESMVFFQAIPSLNKKLQTLIQVGLGYIKLGQNAVTLSGGEAQRIKLAKELSRRATGQTIYLLDEPTTGLHFHDIKRLLEVLLILRDQGNTIIIIEHNLDVIKTADWIIDLGPEGGDNGGQIVASGTPEKIAKHRSSITGKFLKEYL